MLNLLYLKLHKTEYLQGIWNQDGSIGKWLCANGGVQGMKYIASVGLMLMVNNEVFSLAILFVIALMFIGDIMKARFSL